MYTCTHVHSRQLTWHPKKKKFGKMWEDSNFLCKGMKSSEFVFVSGKNQ